MDTVITGIQIILGLFFSVGGLVKLIQPYARFITLPFQGWANDFKPEHVRLIGVLEVSGGAGLFAPLFLHSLTMLTSAAAVGIALLMSGAMATHLRRSEYANVVGNLLWLGVALFVAYGKLVGFAV